MSLTVLMIWTGTTGIEQSNFYCVLFDDICKLEEIWETRTKRNSTWNS